VILDGPLYARILWFHKTRTGQDADNIAKQLETLASAVFIEEVSDLDISELEVHKDQVRATGTGLIGVRLEYAGGKEKDGVIGEDAFPFSFRVTLNRDLEVVSVDKLEVDTSSFYE